MRIPTFKPDHQRHLQLQLSTGLGDAVGDDGTVDDPTEDVDQDGLNLWKKGMNKCLNSVLETLLWTKSKLNNVMVIYYPVETGIVQKMYICYVQHLLW